eukprot:gene5396-10785_t
MIPENLMKIMVLELFKNVETISIAFGPSRSRYELSILNCCNMSKTNVPVTLLFILQFGCVTSLTSVSRLRSLARTPESASSHLTLQSTLSKSVLSTKDKKYDWGFVDKVCLITTTTSDPNRLERTRKELDVIGLSDRVQLFTFEPDNEDRARGCYTSHIKVIQQAIKDVKNTNGRIMILEDNLEKTMKFDNDVIKSVKTFVESDKSWDVFHLGYMMYVPNLSIQQLPNENIVEIQSDTNAALGTTAYLISKKGAEKILEFHKKNGYIMPIPNVVSTLFANSRYGAYPMLFHRAAKVASLVNPKLDDFRKVVFNPFIYSTWELLMYSTGLPTNKLFP